MYKKSNILEIIDAGCIIFTCLRFVNLKILIKYCIFESIECVHFFAEIYVYNFLNRCCWEVLLNVYKFMVIFVQFLHVSSDINDSVTPSIHTVSSTSPDAWYMIPLPCLAPFKKDPLYRSPLAYLNVPTPCGE